MNNYSDVGGSPAPQKTPDEAMAHAIEMRKAYAAGLEAEQPKLAKDDPKD